MIPQPPWPPGDERGMANATGAGTWLRCVHHMSQADARMRANFDENYERLVELKDKYDPRSLFRLNANVRPTVARM
jgi:hypothetical protein